MMDKSERDKNLEELANLEILLDIYSSTPQLMNREGAEDYIDSILDRINELNKKLTPPPLK